MVGLDLRYVNQFLPDQKFKYEGLELILTLFDSGDFFTTFDLKVRVSPCRYPQG